MSRLRILVFAGLLLSSAASTWAETIKPERYFLVPGLKNESNAGIVITTGNTRTQTLDFRHRTDYEWNVHELSLNASFLRASSAGKESAFNWSVGPRYGYQLSDRWALFAAQRLEGNRFAGFFQRYSTDSGGRLRVYRTENFSWDLEAGHRYLRENRIEASMFITNLARAYSAAEWTWTRSARSSLWVEFLQGITRPDDQFANGEFSLSMLFNDIFSIKTAYRVSYRRVLPPLTFTRTDTTLTTAIVASF